MAKRSDSTQKPRRTPGNRKNQTLVALAGLLLVVWGFVLGVLVGRGTMPTLIPEKTAQVNQAREESKTSVTDKAVTTTKVSTTTTTSSTLAETTTTFGFYKKLPENVAETLPPLPPPTTNKPVENKNKQPTKSYVSKRKPEESKEKAPEPKKEPKAKKPEPPAQKGRACRPPVQPPGGGPGHHGRRQGRGCAGCPEDQAQGPGGRFGGERQNLVQDQGGRFLHQGRGPRRSPGTQGLRTQAHAGQVRRLNHGGAGLKLYHFT